jgi:hypothetical protein
MSVPYAPLYQGVDGAQVGLLRADDPLAQHRTGAVANVGIRWPSEVDRNVDLVEAFEPLADLAEAPRLTAAVYAAEDREQEGP